jgi:two-component system sensor histidine kinase MtrB
MAHGQLDARLEAGGNDEFAVLARSFNAMADALEVKLDELAWAAERERQFTADVAHDLRTPLTGMAAAAAILEEQLDDVPIEFRRSLGVLVGDVRRFRDLVLELLELSRLDDETVSRATEELDVAKGLAAVFDGLSLGQSVTIDVDRGLRIACDRSRFRRILTNLAVNASIHGGGRIDVRAYALGGDGVIEVCDEGPGIPPDQLERIFDRLYKGDASRGTGGSGLGLAIARKHARVQGGDVRATNRPSGGACFTVTLPLAEPETRSVGSSERVSVAPHRS